MEVSEQEPGNIVEDVVQAGHQQHSVEKTVEEQTDWSGAYDPVAQRIDAAFEPWEAKPEEHCADDPCETRGDGNEPPATEKGQIVGELDVRETIVEHPRCDSRKNSSGNAELRDFLC